MTPYLPRHARTPDPGQLPEAMRGLADLIRIIPSEPSDQSGNHSPERNPS